MHVTMISHTPLNACIEAAGVCRNNNNPKIAFINALRVGHDSLRENWTASFKIEGISRVLSHQLVRYRIGFSFAQQSQRHVKVAQGDDWYVTPPTMSPSYHSSMEAARQAYEAAIAEGVPLEDARYILPESCKTHLVATINGRALHHFFHQRLCTRAQWEHRELANVMFSLCYQAAPILFEGPYPNCAPCKEKCK